MMTATERLRSAIEKEVDATLWGIHYRVTPRLVDAIFGDGKQLIWLQAINTRPNFYVVRVHSGWHLSNWDKPPVLSDYLDELLDEIEAQFGSGRCDEECPDDHGFPELGTWDGDSWGTYRWPNGLTNTGFPETSVVLTRRGADSAGRE